MQIGKGIASMAAAAWTRQGTMLVLYIVAGRTLMPDEVGVFALAAALVLLFECAIYDSLSEAIVQRKSLDALHVGSALALAAGLAAAIAGAGWLLAAPAAAAFAMPDLTGLIRTMSLGVAILCFSAVHFGILRREARFHAIAVLATIAAVLSAGLGAGLLLAGFGIKAMTAYFFSEKVVLSAGTIWLARTRPLQGVSVAHARALLPFAATIAAQRMAFYARSQADRVVIGMVGGAATLGAYQIAARLFDSLQAVLLTPTSKLFFVRYTQLQGAPDELRPMFVGSLRAVALIALPAFLGVSAVAPEVITILFGPEWRSSAVILEILAFGGAALTLSIMSGAVLSAMGHARAFLLVEVCATLAGLVLLVALARLDLAWIAAAFVIREAFAVALYSLFVPGLLQLDVRGYLGAILPCLVSGLLMWAAIAAAAAGPLSGLSDPVSLLAKIAIGVVVYGVAMLGFGRGLIREAAALLAPGMAAERGRT